jgi:hypothetical protein
MVIQAGHWVENVYRRPCPQSRGKADIVVCGEIHLEKQSARTTAAQREVRSLVCTGVLAIRVAHVMDSVLEQSQHSDRFSIKTGFPFCGKCKRWSDFVLLPVHTLDEKSKANPYVMVNTASTEPAGKAQEAVQNDRNQKKHDVLQANHCRWAELVHELTPEKKPVYISRQLLQIGAHVSDATR